MLCSNKEFKEIYKSLRTSLCLIRGVKNGKIGAKVVNPFNV